MVAAFTAVQPVLDLFLFWVPFYYMAKLAAAVYLWYPSLHGASHLFEYHVRPLVEAHEPAVDTQVETLRRSASGFVSANFFRGSAWVQERVRYGYAAYQAQAQRVSAVRCARRGGVGALRRMRFRVGLPGQLAADAASASPRPADDVG